MISSFFAEPGTSTSALWITGLGIWLVAVVCATYRSALQECSRSRLLEGRGPVERERLERALKREDSIDLMLSLFQFVAETGVILALNGALPAFVPGTRWSLGEPGSLVRAGWAFLAAVLLLFPTVHTLPHGLTVRGNAEGILRPALRTLAAIALVLSPLLHPVLRLRGSSRWLHPEAEEEKEQITTEIIDAVEHGERAGALEESEAQMIENVLSFQKLYVSEAMTPRTDMTSVSVDATMEEACLLAHQEGHSKIPVFRKNRDDICGIFHLRDVMPFVARNTPLPTLEQVMRPAYFVPETKRVGQLLREFQTEKQSIAIVLDEYGGTAGLITVEDILEEIVGDLWEEHDIGDIAPIQRIGKDVVYLDPRLRIEEANEELSIHLPESDDYDTVGGFVFSHLDRIPDAGEVFVYDGLEFRVIEADHRRITRLQLRTLQPES